MFLLSILLGVISYIFFQVVAFEWTFANIVVVATPFITLFATWVTKQVGAANLPGWALNAITLGLAGLTTLLTNVFADPTVAWYLQWAAGLLSISIHEVIKNFSPKK